MKDREWRMVRLGCQGLVIVVALIVLAALEGQNILEPVIDALRNLFGE